MKSTNNLLQKTPVAIIGMSSIFAQAKNLREYWQNIIEGKDCITDVPPSRWEIEDHYDPDPTVPDKSFCKRGGFIPDIDFNPMEFGFPPNMLEVTDVAQLLSLLAARDAFRDAGYGDETTFTKEIRDRTGVILGVGGGQKLITPLTTRLQVPVLEKVLRSSGLSDEDIQNITEKFKKAYIKWNENSFPGMLGNIIAGRITNRFDLGGINSVVDAACAGSLSAIKMSVNELILGSCDMMLAGGVDADNSPFMYLSFSKTPAFSYKGISRPFDAEADGMLIGEGIGMLVCKRLVDAERDGDRIYAVIKGIGSSSDGRSSGIYAPRASGQALAMRRTYEEAGYPHSTVGLIEAHGTGTIVGDPTEFESMRTVFGENGSNDPHIALGSVKSQIGHAKTSSGVAGIIKVALALYHKVLPGTINVTKPNPKFNIESSPFYINSQTRPWIRAQEEVPRRAGLSAFGFGGVNVHATLEEYQDEHDDKYRMHTSSESIIIHSQTPDQLSRTCEEVIQKLQSDEGESHYVNLIEESKKSVVPKESARLGFVCNSIQNAIELLNTSIETLQAKQDQDSWELPRKGIFYREKGLPLEGKIVALFPGQGSQYVNMGKILASSFPPIRRAFADADSLFIKDGLPLLSKVVFPIPAFSEEQKRNQEKTLTKTENAQPAIGTFSVGLYQLFEQAGFKPDFIAGHSFGELTALWAAGVYDDTTFLNLAKSRGQAMMPPTDDPAFDAGSMLAVKGDAVEIQKEIEQLPEVRVANINSNKQVVLGGSTEAIKQAQSALQEKGYSVVLLPVSAAFHTPLVKHAQEPFAEVIKKTAFKKPKIEVYSNTTAKPYPKETESIKSILQNHILNPVLLKEQIENIYKAGGQTFIEFGPNGVLTNLVKDILKGKPHLAIALNANPKKDSDYQLREAIVHLRVAGLELHGFDPYQKYAEKEEVNSKNQRLQVKLNGSNYVSEKTQKAFEDSMKDGYQVQKTKEVIKTIEVPAAPDPAPAKVSEPSAAPNLTEILDNLTLGQITDYFRNKIMGNPTEFRADKQKTAEAPASASFIPAPQPQVEPSVPVAADPVAEPVVATAGVSQLSAETLSKSLLEIVSEKTGYPVEMIELEMNMEADLGIDSIKRVEIFGAMQEKHPSITGVDPQEMSELQTLGEVADYVQVKTGAGAVSAPQPQVEPSVPVAADPVAEPVVATAGVSQLSAETLSKSLLEIVSEKTGYPVEMIELEMNMEADLGIDSIKRVEIFGAMQEKHPSITGVDPQEMSELQTLGEVADYVQVKTGAGAVSAPQPQVEPSVPVAADPVAEPVVAAAGVSQLSAETLSKSLLEIVSEKTGYPVEMIELEMNMEADLGIDSIKRVEIFGAMQEKHPSITGVDPQEMSELQTLGEVADYVQVKTGAGAVSAPQPQVEPSVPVAADPVAEPVVATAGVSQLSAETLSKSLLEIVSEKTGYPVEMIELEMNMEADLGIDSIKRVEIFGAMQEKHPSITGVDPQEMSELQTLGEVADYVQVKTGAGAVSAPQPQVEPSVPVAADPVAEPVVAAAGVSQLSAETLSKSLLEIVSEKTGYPVEMIELEMNMEADLGIDSIKRVEIFGAMQEKHPSITGVDPQEMSELQTLGEVADYVQVKTGAGAVSAPQPQVEPSVPVAADPVAEPVVAAAGVSQLSTETLSKSLLEIVSEKTGYPVEMIELEMNMEADLGIDSIKRVEIFGAMQEKHPSITGVDPQEMSELQTLGEVADYVQIKTGAGNLTAPYNTSSTVSGVPIETNQGIKRSEVKLKYLPLPDFMDIAVPENYFTLVVDDGSALTTSVVKLLLKQDTKVAVLTLPESIIPRKNKLPKEAANIVLENASDECIKTAVKQLNHIASFIHLHPHFEITDGDFSKFFEKEKAIIKAVFLLAKYLKHPLEKAAKVTRASFMTVTRLDGEFGLGENSNTSPICGGLFGLTKTLNLEWQPVFCRTLDLDPNLKSSAQHIITEMHDPNAGLIEVGYSKFKGRQTLIAEEVRVDKSSLQQPEITPSSVFLVSGGGRGVTAKCVIKLAEVAKCRFILLGRSTHKGSEPDWSKGCSNEKELKGLIMQDCKSRGEKPTLPGIQKKYHEIITDREISHTLQAIKQAGGDAVYLTADVTDAASLKNLLPNAIKQMGNITGMIHGAGRLADKLIEDKTEADFESVYSAKTEGLLTLLNCVPIDDLKHLIFFSSVAGFYGNIGQSDYAIANETLNKTAHFIKKRQPSCHVSAINWGPWDSGMVRPELKKLFEENNIELIPTHVGASMFVDEMNRLYKNQAQVVIGNALPLATSYIDEDLKTYRIHRKLTLDANPFLNDHTIDNHPVVPVVSAIGWMSNTCEQIYPDFMIFSCEDHKLFKGIVLDERHAENYILDLKEVKKNNDEIIFEGLIWSHGSNGSSGKKVFHYSSIIKLLKTIPEAPIYQNGKDTGNGYGSISSDELYRNGTLFHGPTFQGIKNVSAVSPEKIVIECQLPRISEKIQGQFPVHTINTLLSDMQYQAMLVWVKHFHNAASLPMKTERAMFYKTIPFDKKFYISVEVKTSNNYKMVADIATYDENDRLYIHTQGAEVALLPPT